MPACSRAGLIVAAICLLAAAGDVDRGTAPRLFAPESSVIGRLHAVDTAGSRLLILPDGRKNVMEISVTSGTEIRVGSRRVELRALLATLGARVKARYQVDAGARLVARLITVDPRRPR